MDRLFDAIALESPLPARQVNIQSDIDEDTIPASDEFDRMLDVVLSAGVRIFFEDVGQWFYQLPRGRSEKIGPFPHGETVVVCAYTHMRLFSRLGR